MVLAVRVTAAVVAGAIATGPWVGVRAGVQPGRTQLTVDAVAVPLDPATPERTAIGDFVFAGGLALSAPRSDRFHGLSDLALVGPDRIVAVGDEGVLVEARLVFDGTGRLTGVRDVWLSALTGEDGRPFEAKSDADAEGLALLPGIGRLVSFERRHRILLYPDAGAPRVVPHPAGTFFAPNAGMEALTADPAAGADAYVVGSERSGETWTCRLSGGCEAGTRVEMPLGFGLVAMQRLDSGRTAVLLRAWDPLRGNRVSLRVVGPGGSVARLDLARPLTVDNFEGVAAVALADGRTRFYLLSDDNVSPSQRTLLLAFDWPSRQR